MVHVVDEVRQGGPVSAALTEAQWAERCQTDDAPALGAGADEVVRDVPRRVHQRLGVGVAEDDGIVAGIDHLVT